MLIKEMLVSNQKSIDTAIKQIAPTFVKKPSNTHQDFLYTSRSLVIRRICGYALHEKPLKGEEYIAIVHNLLADLAENKQELSMVAMQIRLDVLLYIAHILAKAILRIKNNASHKEYLQKILACQQEVEGIIRLYFINDFKLETPFSLSGIRQQYRDSYALEYGQGTLGFFKLPIKRFFQQNTRAVEIKFLEDVESHCQKNYSLSANKKNQLRVSAASLVYMQISTEDLGRHSILARILSNRHQESSLSGTLHVLIDNFVKECRDRRIDVPGHLERFYDSRVLFSHNFQA